MEGDKCISLLGVPTDDSKLVKFLAECGIQKSPKIPSDDVTTYLSNEKTGVDFTFRSAEHLKVKTKDYPKGTWVLSNITFYDSFSGKLPHGLSFDMDQKAVHSELGKPAWQSKSPLSARWDFKGYCIFIDFEDKGGGLKNIAIQLPVK